MTTFMPRTSGLIREIFLLEFGDPDKDAAFLEAISPIEDVDKIVDPLFVYAGANDPRVPRTESDQIVDALRSRGVAVEYMVAENEGHSLARRENLIEFLVARRCSWRRSSRNRARPGEGSGLHFSVLQPPKFEDLTPPRGAHSRDNLGGESA